MKDSTILLLGAAGLGYLFLTQKNQSNPIADALGAAASAALPVGAGVIGAELSNLGNPFGAIVDIVNGFLASIFKQPTPEAGATADNLVPGKYVPPSNVPSSVSKVPAGYTVDQGITLPSGNTFYPAKKVDPQTVILQGTNLNKSYVPAKQAYPDISLAQLVYPGFTSNSGATSVGFVTGAQNVQGNAAQLPYAVLHPDTTYNTSLGIGHTDASGKFNPYLPGSTNYKAYQSKNVGA